jgi:transcriptional regulator with XRE-family HTH domain
MNEHSYVRNCKSCGRTIRMSKMPAGQWVAFDPDGNPHDCAETQSLTQRTPNVPAAQPDARREFGAYGTTRASSTFDDLGFVDVALPASAPSAASARATEAPWQSMPFAQRSSASSGKRTEMVATDDQMRVVRAIAASITAYPNQRFQMSGARFDTLFDTQRLTHDKLLQLVNALRALGVEMVITNAAPNDRAPYWVMLFARSGAALSRSQAPILINQLPTPAAGMRPPEPSLEHTTRALQEQRSTLSSQSPQPTAAPTNQVKASFGAAVRATRVQADRTLDDVAEAAGISASHLSRIERDRTSPSFTVVADIARALNVSIEDLQHATGAVAAALVAAAEPRPMRQQFGVLIRELRLEQGLTLDALALAAGISASHLSRLERGATLPSFVVVGNLAAALRVSVDVFQGFDDTRDSAQSAPIAAPPPPLESAVPHHPVVSTYRPEASSGSEAPPSAESRPVTAPAAEERLQSPVQSQSDPAHNESRPVVSPVHEAPRTWPVAPSEPQVSRALNPSTAPSRPFVSTPMKATLLAAARVTGIDYDALVERSKAHDIELGLHMTLDAFLETLDLQPLDRATPVPGPAPAPAPREIARDTAADELPRHPIYERPRISASNANITLASGNQVHIVSNVLEVADPLGNLLFQKPLSEVSSVQRFGVRVRVTSALLAPVDLTFASAPEASRLTDLLRSHIHDVGASGREASDSRIRWGMGCLAAVAVLVVLIVIGALLGS